MPAHYTWDDIHRSNAAQAIAWADCTREEALTLLRIYGSALVNTIRPLNDGQLDRTATSPLTGETLITQQFAEGMIEHTRIHLNSARTTTIGE